MNVCITDLPDVTVLFYFFLTGLNVARQSSFAFEFSGLNGSMLWLDGICRCLDAIAGAWPNFKMKIHLHIVSKVLDL